MKLETRTNYRKPRVNSLTTGVKDDRHRNNQTNYNERRDYYKQNKEEQIKSHKKGKGIDIPEELAGNIYTKFYLKYSEF